ARALAAGGAADRRRRARARHRRRDADRAAADVRGGVRVGGGRAVHGRRGGSHADDPVGAGGRLPTRLARAAQAVALPRGARRPRLRHARRREGGRRPGARPPPDAAAGALGAAGLGGGRRARAAGDGSPARRRRPDAPLTRRASPKLAAYAGLAGFGLLAALDVGRPEIVALTAPFLLALGLGLALSGTPAFTLQLTTDERAVEGDEVPARIRVETPSGVDRLDLYLRLPDGLALADGDQAAGLHIGRGETRELELTLSATRW